MSSETASRSPTGLSKTLAVLAQTQNEAAISVLVPALDSANQSIQHGALDAILARRSLVGQREILARLHIADEGWRTVIDRRRGRMSHALRDGVLGADEQLCRNACQAIVWFREYDLVSALINAAEDETHENGDLAAATLLSLAEALCKDLSGPPDYATRRDPQLIRQHMVSNLEACVQRYARHRRDEIVAAFLCLASRDNAMLRGILQDPHHTCYLTLLDCLLHSDRRGVIRLLVSFLDDVSAPTAALSVLSRRKDAAFLEAVFRKIGAEPGCTVVQNLKRIESIPWLRTEALYIERLAESLQVGLIQLVLFSGIKRIEAYQFIEFLLRRGQPAARSAAAQALAHFPGGEANELTLSALADADPHVQAAAIRQLRQRGIPDALSRLIQLVDHPHPVVRAAARESLSEFNFERFTAAFDMLDDDVRQSTGVLVRKICPEAKQSLESELLARTHTRRLRALAMAVAMSAIDDVQAIIAQLLLEDRDHLVRSEAARVLAHAHGDSARSALQAALTDRSVAVQEAARTSLALIQYQGPAATNPSF